MPNTPPSFRHSSFTGWIGVARVDITPPVGVYSRNWGAALHDAARGIHRPLSLTAVSLQERQDSDPLVLIDADAGWFHNVSLANEFRTSILDQTGLTSARFIFALSHTHASVPLTNDFNPAWEGGELLAPYFERVREAAKDVVKQAKDNARQGTLEWHYGRCGLAAVRDLVDPSDEHDRRICGYDPSVRADDTLLVGRATDTDGQAIATICNYACHPTTLAWDNKLLSPDYVGAMRETVENANDGAPAIFLQGASGELAPRYQYVGDTAVADQHGRQLGHAVLATLADMEPPGQQLVFKGAVESGAPLAAWDHEPGPVNASLSALEIQIELPIKDWPSADELEQQRLASDDRVTSERLRRKRNIRRCLGDGDTYCLPSWLWRIGDAILVGNMAESYSWIQQHLRRSFPNQALAYVNLVNGSIGYLPPVELYDEDVYQVWQTPFERGSLEQCAQALEDGIRG